MEATGITPTAVYTTEEAAELLKVSTATIQRYIRSNKLNAIKLGNKWYRLSGQALLDFMGLESVDIACVLLENALCSLDVKKRFNPNFDNSRFYNVGSAVIKRLAQESKTRSDLIKSFAEYINNTMEFNLDNNSWIKEENQK